MAPQEYGLEGGCTCGDVRYKVISEPLIVHCCHCRNCQRQSGTAFALNALFETEHVQVLQGEVDTFTAATPSGKGQRVARCPNCRVAVWSNYYMGGIWDLIRFVRVGTLDDPDQLPPDVHIHTASKQPWVQIAEDSLAVEAFYDFATTWSPEKQARREALLAAANN